MMFSSFSPCGLISIKMARISSRTAVMTRHAMTRLTHLRDTYSSEGEDADIILVDDTEPNVTTALSMGLKGVHVKGAAGMDDNDLDRLHQALESLDVSKKCILALDFDLTMCKTHLTSVFCYPYLQETGGRLDQAGLMQRIPDDMLVPCVAPLVSAFAPPASQ